MRLHFKRVKYKNILSTGNTFTTIDLDRRSSTLISGSNGAGKSTLLDAITFGLYGKPFRKINKPQLVNSINQKEMEVQVEFSVGGKNYLIRRGIKPALFEIYKEGELLNQDAAVKDYQAYLEENILGINAKSFTQIVVLGSATYVPFMELPAHSRRDIIEDLLEIQVFSTMNLLVKDKVSENKNLINDNSYQLDLTNSKIDSAEEHNDSIRKIRETEVEKIKERMKEHLNSIDEKQKSIEAIDLEIKDLIDTIKDKKNAIAKYDKALALRSQLEANRRNFEKDLSFYHDNDNCPTCRQGIDHDFKATVVEEKGKRKEEIETGLVDIDKKITEYKVRIDEIVAVEDKITEKNLSAGEVRAEINMAKNALKSYAKELKDAEKEVEEVDNSKLQTLKEAVKQIETDRKELLDEKSVLAIVNTILKDGGIKSRIISQYIPIMNKLINKYLAAFDLFVDFQLDENFNEIIKSRFRDKFSYASFSEGEKLRITLSIMLAWRAVAKLRNSVSTNLLMLDETLDGALDGVGIENLIETLHALNADDNIFVISHRGDQFAEKFAAHIKFHKVKNFSEIMV